MMEIGNWKLGREGIPTFVWSNVVDWPQSRNPRTFDSLRRRVVCIVMVYMSSEGSTVLTRGSHLMAGRPQRDLPFVPRVPCSFDNEGESVIGTDD